jgi:hypothetical protein
VPLAPEERYSAGTIVFGIVGFYVIIILVNMGEHLLETRQASSELPPDSINEGSQSGTKTVRGRYWCTESFDDAGQIGAAVTRGDSAAIAGMLARGKAFQVESGTRVVTGSETGMGISLVHIESGFQAGRKCYISTNTLK